MSPRRGWEIWPEVLAGVVIMIVGYLVLGMGWIEIDAMTREVMQ